MIRKNASIAAMVLLVFLVSCAPPATASTAMPAAATATPSGRQDNAPVASPLLASDVETDVAPTSDTTVAGWTETLHQEKSGFEIEAGVNVSLYRTPGMSEKAIVAGQILTTVFPDETVRQYKMVGVKLYWREK